MSCTDCALHKVCNNSLVWGRGSKPKRTEIMIIQDAPSRSDDRFGNAPTGEGQSKLNYFLDQAGIDYKKVYFTSAIKCKPKENSDIKNKHMEECSKYLLKEIIDHKPKIIIAMGRYAYQMISDRTSIREFRGHFDDFELEYEVDVGREKEITKTFRTKIMPTFSLIGSLRKWEYNYDIIRDFKKAKNYQKTGKIDKNPECDLNVILTKQGLKDFVEKYREVTLATTDYETTGFEFFKDKIINAGYFAQGGNVADIIYLEPYKKEHTKKWKKEDIERAKEINSFLKRNRNKCVEALKTVNSFKHLRLVLHNGKFDAKFAKYNNMPYKNFWFDTLIADSLIDENLGHSLNIAMERRGINFGAYDTELWPYTNKDENKKKSYQHVPPFLLEKYLGIDVFGDYLLFKEQIKELKQEGQVNHMFKRKMPAVKKLLSMEYIGAKADKKVINKAAKIIDKKQVRMMKEFKELTNNEEFNPNSPKQIIEHMLDEGYPFGRLKIKETKTGFSTGKDELSKFLPFKKWKTFPNLLLNWKKLAKIRGTYVDGKDGFGGMVQYLDPNHRIHTNFNCWTPRTSRYSSNRPSLQVWPRPIKGLPNMRQMIIPTNKDWCLFEADYSQLEQAIVAALSKDKVLTERIVGGYDLHCLNAVDMGHKLKILDNWVAYEHMVVANEKQEDVGLEEAIVKECLKDIQKHGQEIDWKETRTHAKNLGFGINYGKGAMTFAKEFGITEDEAEEMVGAYFDVYSGMKKWRDSQVHQALNKGYITLMSGRKRRFHAAIDWVNSEYAEESWSAKITKQEIARQAMNTPVQGGAHDVFEEACLRVVRRFKKERMRARLLLSIHDGIVGECPIEERLKVDQILLKEMPVKLNKNTKNEIPLKIDTDYYKWEWYGDKIKL